MKSDIRLVRHLGMLYAIEEYLQANWTGLKFMFPLIMYGSLFQALGMIYDVQLLTMAGHYSFGGVFGIAFGNYLRFKVANKLFKKMDEERDA